MVVSHMVSAVNCPKTASKNLGNQIALLMHYRVMGHSGQVAMDNCHGQVFF
jgi:hypothetical protein